MSGYDQLDAMIARVRSTRNLASLTARELQPQLEQQVRASAAAGTTPDGVAWTPTKAGTPPLQNAPSAIRVRALGTVVQWAVTGHHFFHQTGRGVPRRQIIPDALTPKVAATIVAGARRVFQRLMNGGL